MDVGDFLGQAVTSASIVAGSTGSLVVSQENLSRTGMIFSSSEDSAVWYIKLGSNASETDFSIRLASGETVSLPLPMHTGTITAVQSVAAGNLMLTEFSEI